MIIWQLSHTLTGFDPLSGVFRWKVQAVPSSELKLRLLKLKDHLLILFFL
jgi:hypothetical protein